MNFLVIVSRGSDDETGRDIITKESVSSHDVTRYKDKGKGRECVVFVVCYRQAGVAQGSESQETDRCRCRVDKTEATTRPYLTTKPLETGHSSHPAPKRPPAEANAK